LTIAGGDVTDLRPFHSIAESISRLLHPHAEVVVHDIKRNTISAIYNSLSKRKVGDPSLIEDAKGLAEGPDVHGPFLKSQADGHRLKYVSTVLRNNEGKAIGLMCVNFHLGELDKLRAALQTFTGVTNDSTDLDSLFDDDWQRKIDTFVREYLLERNRSLNSLTRTERTTLVHDLKSAGGFRTRGAAGYIARVLGVSRATIYNDLGDSNERTTP
jgi:D-arginine utilization repressor